MGKRQTKKEAGCSRIMFGVLVSLGSYLLGITLLALLMVQGILLPDQGAPLLSVWAMLSAACGSLLASKTKVVTPLLACLIQGASFALSLILVSYLFWEGPVWCDRNIRLLLWILLGGMIPGIVARGKGRKRRKRAW